MSKKVIFTGILAIIFLVNLIPSHGVEDWDGILCYAGKKATPKTCNSCVTVHNNCNYFFIFFEKIFQKVFERIVLIL